MLPLHPRGLASGAFLQGEGRAFLGGGGSKASPTSQTSYALSAMCLRILASQSAERGSGVRPEAVFSTAWEMLPCVRPKEYFRPGQVDAVGRFNNVAIGRDLRRPRLRLPGSGGIPDVTTVFTDIHLYVPRHSLAVFV